MIQQQEVIQMDNKAQANNKTSIYAIGALKNFNPKTPISINNVIILSRNPRQLQYEYVFPKSEPDQNRLWQISVREDVGGLLIDSKEKFYNFIMDYLNDRKQIEAGQLPSKLVNDFYIFKQKQDANKVLQDLANKQDKNFANIYDVMKPYTPKQKLIVIDMIEALASYVPLVLKDMMADPATRKTFEKNVKQFKDTNEK